MPRSGDHLTEDGGGGSLNDATRDPYGPSLSTVPKAHAAQLLNPNSTSASDTRTSLAYLPGLQLSPRTAKRMRLVRTYDALSATLLANRMQQARIVDKLLEIKKLHSVVLGANGAAAKPVTEAKGLLGRLDAADRYEEEDERKLKVVDVSGCNSAGDAGKDVEGCKLMLPVFPQLLHHEPFQSENTARMRYRHLFTSAGLSQTFSSLPSTSTATATQQQQWTDTAQLRHTVLNACKRYTAVRTAKEGSAEWFLELLRMHSTFPAASSTVRVARALHAEAYPTAATEASSGAIGLFAPLLLQLSSLQAEQSPDPETLVELLMADKRALALALISLPLPCNCPVASAGIEADRQAERKAQRTRARLERRERRRHAQRRQNMSEGPRNEDATDEEDWDEQRPSQRSGSQSESEESDDDSEEVDLLDWASIAKEVHPVLTAETCRTRWLMVDRPSLPLPPPAVSAAMTEGSSADTAAYWRAWPRHLRWHLTGPNNAPFSEDEDTRLLAIVRDMTAEQQTFAGRWEEAARRLGTSRQGAQVLVQYQRLTTASKTRSKGSAVASTDDTSAHLTSGWTLAQEAELKRLVRTYGARWSLFAELLDMPLRNGSLISAYYWNNLDPGVITAKRKGRDECETVKRRMIGHGDASSSDGDVPTEPEGITSDAKETGGLLTGKGKVKTKANTKTETKTKARALNSAARASGSGSRGGVASTWTASEDAILQELMLAHDEVPPWLLERKRLPGRTASQCKERWVKVGRKAWQQQQQQR